MKVARVFVSYGLIVERLGLPAGTRVLRAAISISGELELVLEHDALRDVNVSFGTEPPIVCPVYSVDGFERWVD